MIQLKNIYKCYSNSTHPVIDNVSFTVQNHEILVLLGLSGSGKTTLLKMVNGLISPTAGTITIEQKNINDYNLIELRRRIGYVFQQIGLFPHMTVEKNIAIPLKLRRTPKAIRKARVYELLELIHLNPKHYANRYPDELSGGQQQRVGVARALAADPNYLLMDEPFTALDPITRNNFQTEILRLNEKLHKTILFVTHDIHEAFRIADRIAILHQGKLAQIGTKKMLIENPASNFVKQFITEPKQHTISQG